MIEDELVYARLKLRPTAVPGGYYAVAHCGHCQQELTVLLWEGPGAARGQVLGHEQDEQGVWRLTAYAAGARRAAELRASRGTANPEDGMRLRHNRWSKPGDRSADGITTPWPEASYPPNSFAAREAPLPSRFALVHRDVRWHCPKCQRENRIVVPDA